MRGSRGLRRCGYIPDTKEARCRRDHNQVGAFTRRHFERGLSAVAVCMITDHERDSIQNRESMSTISRNETYSSQIAPSGRASHDILRESAQYDFGVGIREIF